MHQALSWEFVVSTGVESVSWPTDCRCLRGFIASRSTDFTFVFSSVEVIYNGTFAKWVWSATPSSTLRPPLARKSIDKALEVNTLMRWSNLLIAGTNCNLQAKPNVQCASLYSRTMYGTINLVTLMACSHRRQDSFYLVSTQFRWVLFRPRRRCEQAITDLTGARIVGVQTSGSWKGIKARGPWHPSLELPADPIWASPIEIKSTLLPYCEMNYRAVSCV